MTDQFDPYHSWLAIPKHEQPADHYRLLGLPRYEESPDVISNAADQRSHFLRTVQTGRHSAESQRLLNEVAAAAGCLLNPERKAAYDRQLRALEAQRTPPSLTVKPMVISSSPALALTPAPQSVRSATPGTNVSLAHSAALPRQNAKLIAAAIALPVALALVVVVVLSLGGGNASESESALIPPPPAPNPARATTTVPDPGPSQPSNVSPSSASPAPVATSPIAVPSESQPAETQPAEPQPANNAPTPAIRQGVDLLQAGKVKLAFIRGYVTRKGALIRTPDESTAFSLPAEFPESYVLEIDVVRHSGTNAIGFGFTAFEQPLTAVIDGFYSSKSGLASINDREIFTENNPQVKPGPVLTNGQPATVRIEVTRKVVRLAVDQKPIVEWTFDPQARLRSAKGMHGEDLNRLYVFTWDAQYQITRLQLLPAD